MSKSLKNFITIDVRSGIHPANPVDMLSGSLAEVLGSAIASRVSTAGVERSNGLSRRAHIGRQDQGRNPGCESLRLVTAYCTHGR